MNELIAQLARWITPGDARGVLGTFASGIDFVASVPIGEQGFRLALRLQKRPDETFVLPEPAECPAALARLLFTRLGALPWAGQEELESSESELLGNVVCGECGTTNHGSSILCRRCGNRLLESVSSVQITADEVLVLLHVLIARVQADSGDPARSLDVLESQLATLPPHQIIFFDMGVYLAMLGRYHDAACYLWVASLAEPWIAISRPKTLHTLVKRVLELHAAEASGQKSSPLAIDLPKLDETRMKVALGALRRALQQDNG